MTVFMCEKCEKVFDCKSKYDRHLANKRKCFSVNQCRYCEKMLSNKFSKDRHLEVCKLNRHKKSKKTKIIKNIFIILLYLI